jgi:hypothetical protein
MEKGKSLIIKLLIVFISILSIDGGRSLLLTGSKILVILSHNHNEVEVPHKHQLFNLQDDERWVETFKFDFSFLNQYPLKFLFESGNPSQEFTNSIWQPPKFV